MEFDWDRANTRHIARHKITPREAEQVLRTDSLVVQFQDHSGEERVLCFGRTGTGRLLTVLYVERRGKTRVITAYPMTRDQQEVYFMER